MGPPSIHCSPYKEGWLCSQQSWPSPQFKRFASSLYELKRRSKSPLICLVSSPAVFALFTVYFPKGHSHNLKVSTSPHNLKVSTSTTVWTSPTGAAAKITALQSELGLQTVFIATDATQEGHYSPPQHPDPTPTPPRPTPTPNTVYVVTCLLYYEPILGVMFFHQKRKSCRVWSALVLSSTRLLPPYRVKVTGQWPS